MCIYIYIYRERERDVYNIYIYMPSGRMANAQTPPRLPPPPPPPLLRGNWSTGFLDYILL